MADDLAYETTWNRIMNKEHAVTKDEISRLTNGSMPFVIMADRVLNLLIEKYQDKFPQDFLLEDYRSEIRTELVLRLFDFLSIETSEMYTSEGQFLSAYDDKAKADNKKDEINPYIYSSQRRLQDALEELFPPDTEPNQYTIIDGTPEIITRLPTNYESKSILENTKLFEFIYSHMQIEESHNGSNLTHRYLFNKEGSFFLNVVLKAANSLHIPYTVKAQGKLNMNSLNNLSQHLWESFNSSVCKGLEKLLFLFNSEDIFELTFLQSIAQSYESLYSKIKLESQTAFPSGERNADKDSFASDTVSFLQSIRFSLYLINDLRDLPWNSLKPVLWNIYADKFFEIGCTYTDIRDLQSPTASVLHHSKDVETEKEIFPESPAIIAGAAEEMTDCFFYIMLDLYHCLGSDSGIKGENPTIDISEIRRNMTTLKWDLFDFLNKPELNDFTWSILKKRDKKNTRIPNIYTGYIENLVLNVFYATDFPFTESSIDNLYKGTSLSYLLSKSHLS